MIFSVPPVDDDSPILVVDDDAVLRRALSRILRSEGHRVIEAGDGDAALEAAREHSPSLVVLDYSMPGMDGETVLHAMRKEHAESTPPALLLTASGLQQERAEAMGAAVGLCKPFRVQDLLDAVRRHRRSDA
ncbi:MAG: response regulator [Myxococcota bacterium]